MYIYYIYIYIYIYILLLLTTYFCLLIQRFWEIMQMTLHFIQYKTKSNHAILNYNSTILQKWFYENYMVLNSSKYFYMCSGSKFQINDFILEDIIKIPLTRGLRDELLGIMIDTNLHFYTHIKQLCKKVANKFNALTRTIPYLDKKQINLLYNSFFKG